jgi:hypothetical protein
MSTARGWHEVRRQHPWILISGALLAFTLIAADSVPVPLPVPGVRDPYHPLQFLGLLIMIGMLIAMARQSCADGEPTPPVTPHDQTLT